MSRLTDLLFPPVCAGCGELLAYRLSDPAEAFCPDCRKLWTDATTELCGICQKSVSLCACIPKEMERAGCRAFRKLVYYRPGKRDEVQNRVIYRVKDRADATTVAFLARELSAIVENAIKEAEIDRGNAFLVWLPRGRRAVLEHGTDQAKALATELSKLLNLPALPVITRRFGHGKPQKSLSPAERMKNAKAAFSVREDQALRGKFAILIDDIVTSGASMAVGIRLLRRVGVKNVLSVAVASDESNRQPPARPQRLDGELDRIYARMRY